MSDDEDDKTIVIKQKAPLIDTKTLVIGGGAIALIAFLFFRGGLGSGTGKSDKRPLEFKLRSDGFWLGQIKYPTLESVITRVKSGGRNDISVQFAGDILQSDVDKTITALQLVGLVVYQKQPQSVASVYQRGRGFA